MKPDSPHFFLCLEILRQSPLFSSLVDPLLNDMLKIFCFETRKRSDIAILPKQASDHLYLIISDCATRHLQKLKKENVISNSRGNWSVLDLSALLKKAEQLLRD